jgi:hypothetical protein
MSKRTIQDEDFFNLHDEYELVSEDQDQSEESFSDDSRNYDDENGSAAHDEEDTHESMIEFIKKGQDFITLDVMIQMEYCSGMTLRDYLDDKNT